MGDAVLSWPPASIRLLAPGLITHSMENLYPFRREMLGPYLR